MFIKNLLFLLKSLAFFRVEKIATSAILLYKSLIFIIYLALCKINSKVALILIYVVYNSCQMKDFDF